jgi:hypothetical protein
MTAIHKPFSLVYDLETTRPGEQTFAEPDPIGDEFARRLRDVGRAGRLRILLYSATFGALECARVCEHDLHQPERAVAYQRAADFYSRLFEKVCRIEARARGEAAE